MGGRYVPSLLAAIGGIIEQHLGVAGPEPAPAADRTRPSAAASQPCPQCGAAALIRVEDCNNCLDCGYSKCG